jgi:dihydrofolate reductase
MRRIIFFTMISLDRYMEKPGGSLDWISVDEELLRFINNLKRQTGGYLCGRGMYENNPALLSTGDTQSMEDYEVELAENW